MGDKIAGKSFVAFLQFILTILNTILNKKILENDLLRFFQHYIKFFNWNANSDLFFMHDVDEIFK